MSTDTQQNWDGKWGAWVWVKWKQGAPENACLIWKDVEEIKEAWSTTGKWDCAVWVDVDRPEEIERVVWKDIRRNKWVEKTDTHFAKKYW